jgi:hypothetical protein
VVKTPRIPAELISAKVISVAFGGGARFIGGLRKDADGGKLHVCEPDDKAVGWVLRCRLSLSNCDHRHCRSREIAARRMRVTRWQTKPTIVPAGYEFGLRCAADQNGGRLRHYRRERSGRAATRAVVRSSVRFPKIRSSTSFSGSNKAMYGSPESRTWVAGILGIAA